jgi:hypothetical protein
MFDQHNQRQGWFATKWPLWAFVIVWFAADIPMRIVYYFLKRSLPLGMIGRLAVVLTFGLLCYGIAKWRTRRENSN